MLSFWALEVGQWTEQSTMVLLLVNALNHLNSLSFLFTLYVVWILLCMLMLSETLVGPGFDLPAHFSPIYFPMGNAATGFFVTFALLAGVVGVASAISGINHFRSWTYESLPSAATAATIAWTLTLLAMRYLQVITIHNNRCIVAHNCLNYFCSILISC